MSTLALFHPVIARPLHRRKSRAFGLLEVILVFAIVIGAAAIVFTVFGFAHGASEASELADETNLVAANLRASPWGMAHDYSTIPGVYSTQWFPGIYPASWDQSGQAVEPITGNAVGIGPGYTNQEFSITLNYVPADASECQKLGSELAAQGYDDVLWAGAGPTATGGTIFVSTSGPGNPPTTHTIDQAKLANYCGGSAGNLGSGGATPGYSGFTVFGH